MDLEGCPGSFCFIENNAADGGRTVRHIEPRVWREKHQHADLYSSSVVVGGGEQVIFIFLILLFCAVVHPTSMHYSVID